MGAEFSALLLDGAAKEANKPVCRRKVVWGTSKLKVSKTSSVRSRSMQSRNAKTDGACMLQAPQTKSSVNASTKSDDDDASARPLLQMLPDVVHRGFVAARIQEEPEAVEACSSTRPRRRCRPPPTVRPPATSAARGQRGAPGNVAGAAPGWPGARRLAVGRHGGGGLVGGRHRRARTPGLQQGGRGLGTGSCSAANRGLDLRLDRGRPRPACRPRRGGGGRVRRPAATADQRVAGTRTRQLLAMGRELLLAQLPGRPSSTAAGPSPVIAVSRSRSGAADPTSASAQRPRRARSCSAWALQHCVVERARNAVAGGEELHVSGMPSLLGMPWSPRRAADCR